MMIDCDSCTARASGHLAACADCVVSVLLVRPGGLAPHRAWAEPGSPVELDADERRALGVLADHGLVPPLRMEPTG
jgi:hypothetical protein